MKFEVYVWTLSLKFKFEVDIWGWSSKLMFEVESENESLNLKLRIKVQFVASLKPFFGFFFVLMASGAII